MRRSSFAWGADRADETERPTMGEVRNAVDAEDLPTCETELRKLALKWAREDRPEGGEMAEITADRAAKYFAALRGINL